jgi:hypothetical protein
MCRRFTANVIAMPHCFGLDRAYQPQRFAQLHMLRISFCASHFDHFVGMPTPYQKVIFCQRFSVE